jgi:hypothetical protein
MRNLRRYAAEYWADKICHSPDVQLQPKSGSFTHDVMWAEENPRFGRGESKL